VIFRYWVFSTDDWEKLKKKATNFFAFLDTIGIVFVSYKSIWLSFSWPCEIFVSKNHKIKSSEKSEKCTLWISLPWQHNAFHINAMYMIWMFIYQVLNMRNLAAVGFVFAVLWMLKLSLQIHRILLKMLQNREGGDFTLSPFWRILEQPPFPSDNYCAVP